MFIIDNEVKMKESIFRVLSLFIGLGGVFALALDTSIILESTMIGGLLFVAVISSFLLFGLGGSKLISKIPITEWLNETAGSFFNTSKSTSK